MLFHAAKRLGSDARVRAKAKEVFEQEVKPRAEAAWRQAKPKLDAAKAELRDIARETDPRENPREFAAKLKQRIVDRKKRR
jgi:hypothetical protein